jgi:cold shock protein
MSSEQYQGKVTQYHSDKGFGFITSPEGDVFFHISDFPSEDGEPKRHDRVKFNVVKNGDKFKAVKIQRVADFSKKAKKTKAVTNNQAITNALLGDLRR